MVELLLLGKCLIILLFLILQAMDKYFRLLIQNKIIKI